jgi:hypothetical protein
MKGSPTEVGEVRGTTSTRTDRAFRIQTCVNGPMAAVSKAVVSTREYWAST